MVPNIMYTIYLPHFIRNFQICYNGIIFEFFLLNLETLHHIQYIFALFFSSYTVILHIFFYTFRPLSWTLLCCRQCCGAGAGEKGSGSGLVKFSHISTIYTQSERKNRYTLKNTLNYWLKISKLHFLLKVLLQKLRRSREP